MFSNLLGPTLKYLCQLCLPAICLFCKRLIKTGLACEPCQKSLPILPKCCEDCAIFLPEGGLTTRCGECLTFPPPYERCIAAFPYRTPIKELIKALKFHHDFTAAKFLSAHLRLTVQAFYEGKRRPDLIIPVPLHPKRIKIRGFNQAAEIAKPISKALGLPIDYNGLMRSKDTQPQTFLSATSRKENVKAAFECHRKYDNLCIALLDDVVTTGQTIAEISRTLKKAGAKSIHIWTCARNG